MCRLSRHSVKSEPPLPVTIGLMVYNKTRRKKIVDHLAAEGLSINYDRVKIIQEKYCYSNYVISTMKKDMSPPPPPSLKPGYFTTAAVANIDHEPSSSTATKSFHGSSITIFQQ